MKTDISSELLKIAIQESILQPLTTELNSKIESSKKREQAFLKVKLKVGQIADIFGRSSSCINQWFEQGRLENVSCNKDKEATIEQILDFAEKYTFRKNAS